MIDISIDLETWGKRPGCDLRSIGAVVMGNDDQQFYLATDNPMQPSRLRLRPARRYPLTRDPDTVKWWSEQSAEAQSAFADPVDLRAALIRLSDWIEHVTGPAFMSPTVRLWAHGSHFDLPILEAAYHACLLPVPWHYRSPRDTRTLFDAAGIDDHSDWLKGHPGPLGIMHHSLDDAICQGRAVCAAWARLRTDTREYRIGRIAMQQYADWQNDETDVDGAWRTIRDAIQGNAG